jgi:two-component system, chemotaxis family, chemotaxis protein CheY
MQVLVCDDDPTTRFVIKRMLTQNFGCNVTECGDGAAALRVLAGDEKFTFMLLDLEMPGMNGTETLEAIRKSTATRDLPVIVLSNERRREVVQKLLTLKISDYVLKPPRPEQLIPKIQRLRHTLVVELTDMVWTQTIGLPIQETETPVSMQDTDLVEAQIHISGQWRGSVVVACSANAARRAAARMFNLGDEPPSPANIRDTVSELTSLIGGNIKSIVSREGAFLSLPIVIEGRNYAVQMRDTRIFARGNFLTDGQPLAVTVFEASAPAPAPAPAT